MTCPNCKAASPDVGIGLNPPEIIHEKYCPDTWPDWLKEKYGEDKWNPYIRSVALSQFVLCVAKIRIEGAWTAYCNAVPGQEHSVETVRVLTHGNKLPEKIARAVFPEFSELRYARR